MGSSWVPITVNLPTGATRFFMSDCEGRDQVAMAALQGGWRSYEPPLPAFIAQYCLQHSAYFVDIGANTGYYSLLAAVSGAKHVWAFEPEPSIRELLAGNIRQSNLGGVVTVEPVALGNRTGAATLYLPDDRHGLIETSASLNAAFRATHASSIPVTLSTLDEAFLDHPAWAFCPPVLLKIDVESTEPEVLAGGLGLVSRHRPAIVCEMLPDADVDFFRRFMRDADYLHLDCDDGSRFVYAGDEFVLSLAFRDHVFLPREQVAL